MFPLLPQALVALILASPALAAPFSFNDPFKALTARVVKPPEPPVCCLTPLPSTEPVQDDVLLSFEEWKEKRFAMQTPVQDKTKDKDSGDRAVEGGEAATSATEVSSSPVAPDIQDAPPPHFRVPVTDRFNYASLDCSARVHTSHRSAKSPASILSSKRDRYMLSPCRPPKGEQEQQYIVVELCEDIRIDTVQLANFEFFSGVFKDFTVSVSKTYTTDPEGWTFASTHTAKNIRVVQSFHPPPSLRDFYRYIRIDFHSHYSNEYYCPISLLRVYGLTHLEEYKWDMWEQESRARTQHLAGIPSPPLEEPEPEPAPIPDPVRIPASYAEFMDAASTEREKAQAQEDIRAAPGRQAEQTASSQNASTGHPSQHDARTTGPAKPPLVPAPATATSELAESPEISQSQQNLSTTTPTTTTPDQPATKNDAASTADTKAPQHSPTSTHTVENESGGPNGSDPTPKAASAPVSDTPAAAASSVTTSTTRTTVSIGSTVSALSTTSLVPAPAGGESIYRTIMNRLTALEANHTLYARYVEEHTGAVREMLRRVGEDLGRAEGVRKAQAQTYARTLIEWEKQRRRGDAEYRELIQRVEYLSDEIVLEKRLGIAQLLLLLAVLVFMTLTRGSRGEAVIAPSVGLSRSRLRAWGRRNLSLMSLSGSGGGSGDWDWVARLRSRSRSPKPAVKPKTPFSPAAQQPDIQADAPIKLEFPTAKEKPQAPSASTNKPKPPRLNLHGNGQARPRSRTRSVGSNTLVFDDHGQRAHSRTPTLTRTPHRRPGTPTHPYAQYTTPAPTSITHSASQGSSSRGPMSARRWARTAHLHELRGGSVQRLGGTTSVMPSSAGAAAAASVLSLGSGVDVFAAPSPAPSGTRSADLLGMGRANGRNDHRGLPFQDLRPTPGVPDLTPGTSTSDGEGDMWVDTDGSEVGGDGDADAEVEMNSPWVERVDRVAAGV
ncbi:UNC-like C-terminal-domain-containing protein [Mycena albidolilacea]|uniref:UNC-like C-terminal-domain-containing protein n=1 Tax=Mycena albidolilacea TaxID=1033008 RepID=A0AAD7F2Y6_9AGAR|nr:UNC-like C-terminal-domain-containing protein [Mycena albidolilacea]